MMVRFRLHRIGFFSLAIALLLGAVTVSLMADEKSAAAPTAQTTPAKDAAPVKDAASNEPSKDSKEPDDSKGKPNEKPVYEVHEWGVWLADAAIDNVNSRAQFPSSMPLRVDTTRPRKLKGNKQAPSPMNVIVFRGQPVKLLDIDLRAAKGSFVGHYPPAQRPASNRLRWLDNSLLAGANDDAVSLKVTDHWFTQARATDALLLRKGSRGERLLAYDVESPFTIPLKIEGGPDKYD